MDAPTIGSPATPDGALGSGRLWDGDVGVWLGSYVCRAESALSVGRDLATMVRALILRRVSACMVTRIHVSVMSDDWLRTHETDYAKHRTVV
jgi:hypothetical protein